MLGFPCAVIAVIAGEVADDAVAFEYKYVVYDVVQKVSVVTDDNGAAVELGEVFLENAQRDDIQVVGRFVQYQEVRLTHEHRGQM